MNKYFLTGKTGTIGRFMSKNSLSANFDLSNFEEIDTWCEQTELENQAVVHLAAIVGESQVISNPELARKVNVLGAINFAEAALNRGVKKFVFASTAHIYEPNPNALSENSYKKPQSQYAKMKLEAEEAILEIYKSCLDKVLIFRIFSVLDFGTKPYTLGGRITQAIRDKNRIKIRNSLDQRDFLTPKSIAQTIEKCLESDIPGGIYNICSEQPRTVKEVAKEMLVKANLSENWFHYVQENSRVPILCGDGSKLRSAVPGIEELLRWNLSDFHSY
jgi:UDP-glucose 4-epimerase